MPSDLYLDFLATLVWVIIFVKLVKKVGSFLRAILIMLFIYSLLRRFGL